MYQTGLGINMFIMTAHKLHCRLIHIRQTFYTFILENIQKVRGIESDRRKRAGTCIHDPVSGNRYRIYRLWLGRGPGFIDHHDGKTQDAGLCGPE